ncbi:MAG: DUF192 domain-containing protein [Elusimicrobiaceae bacterium]|nr:DUF192 domain-containing protein [Elusimicrobiaceae bacterium]MBP5616470.1 DUF192 domain-containing protein [Elusimicrobiaceae bacterium]
MKCTLQKTGNVIAQQVVLANTFYSRLKGLMGRKGLPQGEALLLDPCPQIHTCFMRFDIDVVFLDCSGRVVAVLEQIKPWRMSKFYSGCQALELSGGSLQGSVQPGDILIFN